MNIKNILGTALTAASLMSGVQVMADEGPRGPDVLIGAANCALGPFRQTVKAHPYNALCSTMPDAEKCLALIKKQMNEVGELSPVSGLGDHRGRVEYCLATFRAELLGTE